MILYNKKQSKIVWTLFFEFNFTWLKTDNYDNYAIISLEYIWVTNFK